METMPSPKPKKAKKQKKLRRGGRKSMHDHRGGLGIITQTPWQQIFNPLAPIEFLTQDGVELIHNASMDILQKIGIEVLYEPAREAYKQAGFEVDGLMVRFDPDGLMALIKQAPSTITFHARNPDRNFKIGEQHAAFCMMGSAPNVSDIEGGRRPGNHADYRKILKLTHSLNCIHLTAGYPVEPIDIPANIRHLIATRDVIELTDKPFHCYSLGPERVRDVIEMTKIARGISDEQLENEPSLLTIVNSNSPLKLDTPMSNGIMEMAKRNQIVCVTPFTLAGAMAPVTLAAALSEQNAEALAGIALAQIIRKGSPVIYGAFTSNVDMRSGAPAFGTPEYTKAALISGQLARRYNLPYRTSNTNASNAPDVQATYESMMSIWGALMGGGNLIKHAAGWIEGGLVCNFEKVIIDAEILQGMTEFFKPIKLDKDSFGFEAIKEVGPGGHFFGSPHTMERYETAFYSPLLSDWRNFKLWEEHGSQDATMRAHKIWKQLINDYEPPPLAPACLEELDAFIAIRTEQGGAENM